MQVTGFENSQDCLGSSGVYEIHPCLRGSYSLRGDQGCCTQVKISPSAVLQFCTLGNMACQSAFHRHKNLKPPANGKG